MSTPTRIQPKRPTTRIRRKNPRVLAMRTRLEAMSLTAFRQLEEQIREFEATGIQGDRLIGFLNDDAMRDAPVKSKLAA